MEIVTPNGRIGTPQWRVEGLAKVTGTALYGADQRPELSADRRARLSAEEPGVRFAGQRPTLYAALCMSPIALGRIREIDESAARAIPGVCEIFTHKNVGKKVKQCKPIL